MMWHREVVAHLEAVKPWSAGRTGGGTLIKGKPCHQSLGGYLIQERDRGGGRGAICQSGETLRSLKKDFTTDRRCVKEDAF